MSFKIKKNRNCVQILNKSYPNVTSSYFAYKI